CPRPGQALQILGLGPGSAGASGETNMITRPSWRRTTMNVAYPSRRLAGMVALLALLLGSHFTPAADAPKGYQAKVRVSAETRLDWTFSVANQSVAPAPAAWLGDYDSTKQNYELFVPADYSAKKAYPVVLFISPGNEPGGWKAWEPVCKKE